MEWKIELNQEVEIISTVVSGILTLDGIKKIYIDVLKLAIQNNVHKLISDYRKVVLDISIFDIYHLPQTLKELGRIPRQKSALVYSVNSPDKSNYSFFDNRCYNSSHNSRVFTDFCDAYQWLVSD
jgi:hypothetical protein